jgi:hypothetical protein
LASFLTASTFVSKVDPARTRRRENACNKEAGNWK